MHFFLPFLLLSFLVLLFVLYKISKDDIVFIRKNVSLEQLFNIAIVVSIAGLFSARLIYVLSNPARGYLNPLVFLLFPYFPGLSLVGCVFGALLLLLYYSRQKKLPIARIADFFVIALYAAIPIGSVGNIFLIQHPTFLDTFFLPILYALLFGIIYFYFFPKLLQNNLQQGSIASLGIILFALISFLTSMVKNEPGLLWFIGIQEVLCILLFFAAFYYLFKQEV